MYKQNSKIEWIKTLSLSLWNSGNALFIFFSTCACLQTYELVLSPTLGCFHLHKKGQENWCQHLLQITWEFLKLRVGIYIPLSAGKRRAHSLVKQPSSYSHQQNTAKLIFLTYDLNHGLPVLEIFMSLLSCHCPVSYRWWFPTANQVAPNSAPWLAMPSTDPIPPDHNNGIMDSPLHSLFPTYPVLTHPLRSCKCHFLRKWDPVTGFGFWK